MFPRDDGRWEGVLEFRPRVGAALRTRPQTTQSSENNVYDWAAGLSLIFGVQRILNFAHGDLLQGVRKNELYKEAFRPNVLLGGAFLIFIFSLNILKIIVIKIGIIRFIKTKLKFENQ